MKHGGDLLTYEDKFDGELIDYSSNINPLGPPEIIKEKILEEYDSIVSYPDIHYRKLRKSVGDYLNCRPENVLVGNGAMEVIDLFCLLAKRVITTSPAFSEYSLRARIHGREYLEINYNDDFSINLEEFERNIGRDDLIILGNPNNPTGLRIEKDILLEIYSLVRARGAFLLLDEAFFEFVPRDYDSIELFRDYDYENVGIIRAATKFFAIPGLRLGYGCVNEDLAKRLRERALTWSVNCFAEIAGRYIFQEQDYIERSKAYIANERSFMLESLEDIKGLKAFTTSTNYILIKLLNKNEEEVFQELLKHGFVVRKCSSFRSLGQNHIRIAIKDRDNNERLLRALKTIDL